MPRKPRDTQNPAQPHQPNSLNPPARPAIEETNPFTDSSFLVTPTVGQSALSSRFADGATAAPPTQPTPGRLGETASEPSPNATPWATRALPPYDATQSPTRIAPSAPPSAPEAARPHALPGANRAARATGAPQRDPAPNPQVEAQRALVRAMSADERQVAVKRGGEAAPAVIIQGPKKAPRTFGPVAPRRRGPTSFLAQFIVTMVTTVVLFSVVTLATPLGQGAIFGDPFQAYANAVPIIPTATPTSPPTATPLPVGYNPGATVIMNMIRSVFGQYAQGALNISRCESGYDPNAWNPYPIGNSHASGVFQILYPSTWDSTSYSGDSPYDANANIHAAYEIFSRDGYSWREWQCKSY